MIIGDTKLYSHRVKADIIFKITNEKIRILLSMLLVSGCHKFPERKIRRILEAHCRNY